MVNAQNLLRSPEYLNRLSVTTGGASFSIDLSLSAASRDCKGGGVYMSLRRPGAYSGRLPAEMIGRAASVASRPGRVAGCGMSIFINITVPNIQSVPGAGSF